MSGFFFVEIEKKSIHLTHHYVKIEEQDKVPELFLSSGSLETGWQSLNHFLGFSFIIRQKTIKTDENFKRVSLYSPFFLFFILFCSGCCACLDTSFCLCNPFHVSFRFAFTIIIISVIHSHLYGWFFPWSWQVISLRHRRKL